MHIFHQPNKIRINKNSKVKKIQSKCNEKTCSYKTSKRDLQDLQKLLLRQTLVYKARYYLPENFRVNWPSINKVKKRKKQQPVLRHVPNFKVLLMHLISGNCFLAYFSTTELYTVFHYL